MSSNILFKVRTAKRLLSLALVCGLLMPTYTAWGRGGGGVPVPMAGPRPLVAIPVPVPFDDAELALPQFVELRKYIKPVGGVAAAVALGKALFWDTQVGSDGKVACATCHFKAGADVRLNNTVHPGKNGVFSAISSTVPIGPNYTLNTNPYPVGDFPFFQVVPGVGRVGTDTVSAIDPVTGVVTAPTATITRSFGDIVGSQGVPLTIFTGLNLSSAIENGTPQNDPIFGNLRQVTGRNSPSVINAVFNYSNFWDGRANNIFNGVNPIGPLDQTAIILRRIGGTLVPEQVRIPNASLASQAVGPPLSDVEMSYRGRTFPDLGRKMINNNLIPLGQQLVSPNDSVLGTFSCQPNPNAGTCSQALVTGAGLNTTYQQMIANAFVADLTTTQPVGNGFTQIEANFSLFWGLSIMMYEATLVSDRTPFDRYQLGNQNAMNAAAVRGFNTFGSKCSMCHSGSEFSSAVIGSTLPGCVFPDCNPLSFTTNTSHLLIQDHQTNMEQALQVFDVISDSGFFNLVLRPIADDIGRGAGTPNFPFPLSFAKLAKLQDAGTLPFETPFLLLPGTTSTTPDGVQGSFKTPGLRNIELNPPYFHNGSVFTLQGVVEFYTRGGNFPWNLGNPLGNPFDSTLGSPEQAINLQPLGKLRGDPAGQAEIVLFLMTLTDERVRNEQAPFDHPEIFIPDGTGPDRHLAATGGSPAPAGPVTITMNPVTSPTLVSFQTITGFVNDGTALNTEATVAVTVNGLESAATVTGFTWTFDILTMPIGNNTVAVTATNIDGVKTALTPTTIQLLPSATITATFQNVTRETAATFFVGGPGVASYQFNLDGGPFSAFSPVTTNIIVSNLADGAHVVRVLGRDASGQFQQPPDKPTLFSWFVKATPPNLTLNQVTSPVKGSLTVTGTADLGIIPEVLINKTAKIGPVSVIGGAWSCQVSGLKNGPATITAIATDVAFNQTLKTMNINVVLPDGAFKGTGVSDITDAIKALRFAVKLDTPSLEDSIHGDVNGDGHIGEDDALLILKKVVGLVNF